MRHLTLVNPIKYLVLVNPRLRPGDSVKVLSRYKIPGSRHGVVADSRDEELTIVVFKDRISAMPAAMLKRVADRPPEWTEADEANLKKYIKKLHAL